MELLKKTIGEILKQNAEEKPQKPAVIYQEGDIQITWKDLDHMVNRVINGLSQLGTRKGDHIAIWATNVPEWYITQLAAGRMGCPLITINPEWKREEIRYALRQSDTQILIMISGFVKQGKRKERKYDYLEIINDLIPGLKTSDSMKPLSLESFPELRRVILVDDKEIPGMVSWKDLIDNNGPAYKSDAHPDDIIMIQYTSGTTGFPKGAMLTHYNILNNAMVAASHMNFTSDDVLCGPVPYYHCFGSILVNMLGLVTGGTVVIPGQIFNSKKTLQAVGTYQCTALHGVPTMFFDEIEELDSNDYDLSTVRTGIIAGAPVDRALMEAIYTRMGAEDMTIGYGLTEASPITHQTDLNDPLERKVNSVGKPIAFTEAKVVNPNTLEDLAPGEVGEIWMKGFNVMKGYYKKPEETAHAITADGWLRSGDLGLRDEEDYYRIVGRLKEMLIVGGHNVYPAEVEQALHSLMKDKIEFLQVVGVPDKRLQEVVGIAVKCLPGKTVELEEIKKVASAHMEWPKVPKYLLLLDDFANVMTVTGKIQKFKLQELFIRKIKQEHRANRDENLIEL